jgi:Cu+-exporting ATPase
MKHHGIKVPDFKKEEQYSKKFGDVVYLAAGGETIAMFFLKIVPNEKIKRSLQLLQKQGVAIIVRTRDSLVTTNSLAEAFELAPERLRVIPFDLHGKFDDCTKYASRGDGNVACSGTFSSFAGALITAKKVMHSILLSSSSLFTGLFLAVILSVIFTVFGGGALFSPTGIIIYNGFFFLAMLLMQGVRRY